MKKIRIIALFLSIVLAFSSIMPIMSFAEGEEQETEETYTVAPYILRTEGVGANKVKVWLELSPVIAEGIAAYQITLQLTNREGGIVAGRNMEFAFDDALADAKIKEAKFDASAQTMKIYVADTKNLVETENDENGTITNILPIGTVTVETLSLKSENPFKIVLCGNTGDLRTVGLDANVNIAAETYDTQSTKFEIPVDGSIFSIPDYSYTLSTEGKGSVKVYKISESGEETAFAQGEAVVENTKVRLDISAAEGYHASSVKVTDKATGEAIAVEEGYCFSLSGDAEIKVVFAVNTVSYSFSLVTSGSGTAKAYKVENGKETAIGNGKLESGTKVKIVATPAEGFKTAKIEVLDKATSVKTLISEDNTVIITSDTEVTVTFEKIPDEPPVDPSDCTCACHKSGFSGFIYRIFRFFWKLFGINPTCECGTPHY